MRMDSKTSDGHESSSLHFWKTISRSRLAWHEALPRTGADHTRDRREARSRGGGRRGRVLMMLMFFSRRRLAVNRICKIADNRDYVNYIHLRTQTIPSTQGQTRAPAAGQAPREIDVRAAGPRASRPAPAVGHLAAHPPRRPPSSASGIVAGCLFAREVFGEALCDVVNGIHQPAVHVASAESR
jgi:hypothetical protein